MSGLPVIILAGRDHAPRGLPPEAEGKHRLRGYKAVEIQIGDRTVLELLIERLRSVPDFGEVYVVGPASVLGKAAAGAKVVDVDGGFGENIRHGIETVEAAHPRQPMGIITSDVLPRRSELEAILEDYRRDPDLGLWFPIVRAPADPALLGASAWKPTYRIPESPGGPVAAVLPGHLAIVSPWRLRMGFMYRLVDLGYRSRNQPIPKRRRYMMPRLAVEMLREDLRAIAHLLPPNLTWTAFTAGMKAVSALHGGRLSLPELAALLGRSFTLPVRSGPRPRVRLPLVDALGLAKDIDTLEEALAFERAAAEKVDAASPRGPARAS